MHRKEKQICEVGVAAQTSSTENRARGEITKYSIRKHSRVALPTCDERPEQSHGSYMQGWGLSILLHVLIGVPFLGAIILLTPATPEALVMPFRWEVAIVSVTPPPIVTAALPTPIAPASLAAQADQMPTESDSRISDQGPAQAFPLEEPPVSPQPDKEPGGEGQDRPRRELQKGHIAETDRSSVPFAAQRELGPPAPDVPSQVERSLSVRTTLPKPTVRQRPQTVERLVQTRFMLPDYGWLSEALRDTIERTKRYPSVARANRWQGQVLVQFSVRRDGHLVDLRVAESSGYVVLDQAALETVRAASPVALRHRLERPMVVVSLPLTYQLE
jgi:protein TonB